MSLFGRAFDALDNAVTDTLTRRGAQRDARRFAASVRPGDTIYTTDTYALPEGDRDLVQAHRVGRGGRVGGSSVEGLFLRSKAISRSRPGEMSLAEYTEIQNAAEPPDMTSGLKPPKRAKTLARR